MAKYKFEFDALLGVEIEADDLQAAEAVAADIASDLAEASIQKAQKEQTEGSTQVGWVAMLEGGGVVEIDGKEVDPEDY